MNTDTPEPADPSVEAKHSEPRTSNLELRTAHAEPEGRTDRFDLRALYETSRLLSTSLELDFVLENLLLTAMSKLLTPRGAVLFYEPLEQAYRVAAAKGRLGMPLDERMSLEVLPGDDVLRGEAVPEALHAHGLTLALPIAHGARRIGWLALGEKATGQPFTTREMEFIRSLVNMSSAAVHNALLVEELRQANRDLDAKVQALNTLFDLSQEFNATLDRARLVQLLSFALMGQMTVRRHVFLFRRDGETAPQVVTSRGVEVSALSEEARRAFCNIKDLVRLDEAPDEQPLWQTLRDQGLAMILPLRHQGETRAALGLGPKLTNAPYEPSDVEFLYALGNLAFVSIQNTYLVEEQVEKRRLEEEIRLARGMQERLLPSVLPQIRDAALAARNVPSREVGGDYYDAIELEGERFLLAIADVTGKGAPAAMLMANLQACIHVLRPVDLSLEEGVGRINQVICENTDPATFITFFCGVYHPDERRLDYVNAGHNPPYVMRADGGFEELATGGLLLGVMPGAPYVRGSVTLAPGDVLACFTDGVTEAMNAAEEEYEEHRLIECLKVHRTEAAQAILEVVHADVRAFAGHPAFLNDDLTLLMLKVTDPS